MELTHSFTIPAGPDRAWQLLTDLHRVGSCFPGATVTEADAEEFSGTVKVKLGPIALTYAGTGKFVERDDAGHRAVIEARGKDRRGNGTASATVTMSVTGEGSSSRAEIVTDLSVTGKPAQFGRGVMQDVSDKLLGQFVACIEGQFVEGGDGATEQSGAADSAAATPAATAAGKAPAAAAAGPADGATPEPDGGTGAESDAAAPVATAASSAPEPTPSHSPVEPTPSPSPQAPPAERGQSPAAPVPRSQQAPGSASWPQAAGAAARGADDAIDLGSAVLPVLLQRYAGALAVGAAAFVAGVLVGRTGRR